MSLAHYIRREVQVRVGGRRIGPLHFGGRLYSVAPLTAWRYYALRSALSASEGAESGATSALPVILAGPLDKAQSLCRMFLKEELSRKDMGTATRAQLEAIWAAACLCNDWGYLENKKGGGKPITLGALALLVCEATHGAYTPREAIFEVPYQEMLAILEDGAALEARRHEDPDKVTEEDFEWFKEHYPDLELE